MPPPGNGEGRAPRRDAATIYTDIDGHHTTDVVDGTPERGQARHADLGLADDGDTAGD